MKTKLLCIIFLSIPTVMAYEMRLSGPNICKQDTIYPYEAIMKRENDDKKKGKRAGAPPRSPRRRSRAGVRGSSSPSGGGSSRRATRCGLSACRCRRRRTSPSG